MNLINNLINSTRKMGHPPHRATDTIRRLRSPRLVVKTILFLVIFTLSFHLPPLNMETKNRQEVIQEILAVLDKYPTGLADATKEELAEVIYEEATRYNHDPKFIVALIAIESSFRYWAVSHRGAKGLMQIMPTVGEFLAQEIGIEWSGDRTLFNPYLNIRMGIYYLSMLLQEFNDPGLALTAYNYGPTRVRSFIERDQNIPIQYYRRILTVYHTL